MLCCRVWFRMRTGRITASNFKRACHTDPANPSKSLIMSICYPEALRFSTVATRWGCRHEHVALEMYTHMFGGEHEDFRVSKCGLFISTEYPFLGASPDGHVQCSCCGLGICEVKVGSLLTHTNACMYFIQIYQSPIHINLLHM